MEKRIRYWYKVVAIQDEGSCAWCFNGENPYLSPLARKLKRFYHDNETVYADPDSSGLFIFKRLIDAIAFIRRHTAQYTWKIKRVIPTNVTKEIKYFWDVHLISTSTDKDIIYPNKRDSAVIPHNTYTCSSLKVIGDVK